MVRDGFQFEGMSLLPLKAEPKTGFLMPGRRLPGGIYKGVGDRIKRKPGCLLIPTGTLHHEARGQPSTSPICQSFAKDFAVWEVGRAF